MTRSYRNQQRIDQLAAATPHKRHEVWVPVSDCWRGTYPPDAFRGLNPTGYCRVAVYWTGEASKRQHGFILAAGDDEFVLELPLKGVDGFVQAQELLRDLESKTRTQADFLALGFKPV